MSKNQEGDHYIWTQYENVNDILRFSLDRKFSTVDTANPDSGDVEAPDGPSQGSGKGPCEPTKPARVLSEKKPSAK